jgi:hypothetical protein
LAFCDFWLLRIRVRSDHWPFGFAGRYLCSGSRGGCVSFEKEAARPPPQIRSFHIAAEAEVGNFGHKLSFWDSFTGY